MLPRFMFPDEAAAVAAAADDDDEIDGEKWQLFMSHPVRND